MSGAARHSLPGNVETAPPAARMLVLNVIVCLLIIWYMPALLPVYVRTSCKNELPIF